MKFTHTLRTLSSRLVRSGIFSNLSSSDFLLMIPCSSSLLNNELISIAGSAGAAAGADPGADV